MQGWPATQLQPVALCLASGDLRSTEVKRRLSVAWPRKEGDGSSACDEAD